uniref:Reverse transcriptase N-terminal domain-containing protein n=1 Tax=Renouxia sp. TaxID=2485823 RepID=A0A3G3MHG7_9FLOR|nr:hypothetical protein [Renouxia sp.]
MSNRKLSRNFSTVAWKDVYWYKIYKYLYSLKARIYKALIAKSYEQTFRLQTKLITSPLIKVLAFKHVVNSKSNIPFVRTIALDGNYFRSFHLGYLINYLSLANDLDLNVFVNYQVKHILKYPQKLEYLIEEVKQIIAIWSLEPCLRNVCYTHDIQYLTFYKGQHINYMLIKNLRYNSFIINIDLSSIFYGFSEHSIISRISVASQLKSYIFSLLQKGILIDTIHFLSKPLSIFKINSSKFYLGCILVHIVIASLCYENSMMVRGKSGFLYLPNMCVLNYLTNLLVTSVSYTQIKIWQQNFFVLLFSNGVILKNKKSKKIVNLSEGFYFHSHFSYHLINLVVKPSLYSQFSLLQQISLNMHKFQGVASFILIIQLNMLLLIWSRYFYTISAKKIFSLLDYLIYLKVRSYIISRYSSSYISIKPRCFPKFKYYFSEKLRRSSWIFSNLARSKEYYKLFFLCKLIWL